MLKQYLTGKLARWTLLLQEFEFDIQHRLGTQHAIVDYLSRIEDAAGYDNELSDSGISLAKEKWLEEMSHFLTIGLPPPRMRMDEKKQLAICSQKHSTKAAMEFSADVSETMIRR
mgnify:CR=1 FL=1